jgi:hypothetical protein
LPQVGGGMYHRDVDGIGTGAPAVDACAVMDGPREQGRYEWAYAIFLAK